MFFLTMRFAGRIFGTLGTAITLAVAALTTVHAQVVTNIINDGTTTANLVLTANMNGVGTAEALLSADTEQPYLVAEQSPGYSDFFLRSVWHPPIKGPADVFYTVSAEAKPLDNYTEYRLGVAGWIDLTNHTCVALEVQPGPGTAQFALTRIDFAAVEGDLNSTTTTLYNLDGSEASLAIGSAWADVGEYDATQFAIFEIAFLKPSTADKGVLPAVTARIEARVLQSLNGQLPTQVGDKISLLTTQKTPVQHRLGYYAYYGSTMAAGERIGFLKNLTYVGPKGPTNAPPSIAITTPAEGATFNAPANVTITATGSDSDGIVVRTELYEGTTLLASASSGTVTFQREYPVAGEFTLSAKAMDDEGAVAASTPVKIKVLQQATGPFEIANLALVPNNPDFSQLKLTVTGNPGVTFRVQRSTDLKVWIDESTQVMAGTSMDVLLDRPVGAQLQYYQLAIP